MPKPGSDSSSLPYSNSEYALSRSRDDGGSRGIHAPEYPPEFGGLQARILRRPITHSELPPLPAIHAAIYLVGCSTCRVSGREWEFRPAYPRRELGAIPCRGAAVPQPSAQSDWAGAATVSRKLRAVGCPQASCPAAQTPPSGQMPKSQKDERNLRCP